MPHMVFVAKSQRSCSWILCHVFKERKRDITVLWEGGQDIRHESGQAYVPLWGEEGKERGPGGLHRGGHVLVASEANSNFGLASVVQLLTQGF